MSLKSLFGKGKGSQKADSKRDFSSFLEDVESVGYIEEYLKDRLRVKSHTDYSIPAEFVQYGSLQEYYDAGIKRIQQLYPYDGTLREKIKYFNDSSGFDLHLFENEYPRTNGYIEISENRPSGGWGTRTSVSGAYGNPATKEYIYFRGGPNVGNVFHTGSTRFSNLTINGQDGNSVEFWLKKSEFVGASKTEREVVLDVTTTGSVEGDHKYGRLTVELDSSDSAKSPFLLTYQSGSTGFKDVRLGKPALYASGSDNKWHHYSFTMQNLSSSVRVRTYVDGQIHQTILTGSSVGSLNTAMVGSIGALVAHKDELHAGSDSQPIVAHNAISFDGTNDCITVSDQAAYSFTDGSTDKPFSISAWVFVGDISSDNGPFVTKVDFTASTATEYLFKQANGKIQMFMYDTSKSTSGHAIRALANATSLTNNTWHHVVMTYDGTDSQNGITLYTDGSETASTKSATQTVVDGTPVVYDNMRNTTTPLIIGATQDGAANSTAARVFEDRMADVVIFDKELSAAEVTEVYNTGKILEMTTFSAYSNIVSWFKMGDGDDTTGTGGIKDYVSGYNGTLTNGAAIITNSGIKGEVQRLQYPGRGYGKLSGSLDEFRFWKTSRSSKQVGRFYNAQVGAGSNTNPENSALGVYYKFNEGVTGDSGIDNVVLDYSGRVSNGEWIGYASVGRHTGSAFTESSASYKEFKDPILYQNHPDVVAFTTSSLEEGYAYDLTNNSSLYHSIPNWIVDEDGEENGHQLRKITQIMASYFDSLFLQIRDMKSVRNTEYKDIKFKPHPFSNVKLESLGLTTPELFMDTETINIFNDRDEEDKFKEKIHNIKNFIYNNIYNNLSSIYKSKGTQRSFRNLFRCFGVDSELIKMNVYSTDSVYPLEDSYVPSTSKTKYLNFNTDASKDASVFQTASLPGIYRSKDAKGYVTGSSLSPAGSTTQAQVFFPVRHPINHVHYYSTPISSSLFGCHAVKTKSTAQTGVDDDWTTSADDKANFQLYAVKDAQNSTTAKFVLTCRNNLFDPIETDFIHDLYSSRRWQVAVRTRLNNRSNPDLSQVSGSDNNYFIELGCFSSIGDQIDEQFILSSSMTKAVGDAFTQSSRRFYVGAHRTNFDGGLLQASDVKVANFRHWMTFLTDDELHAHTLDPSSNGVSNPTRDVLPLHAIGAHVPRSDMLAIDWNVSNLTGSNTNGEMWITDVSSGSVDSNTGGSLEESLKYMYPAKGISFGLTGTGSIDVEYDASSKLQSLENVRSRDMVKVSLNDDVVFTRETKPTDYYFSFEKSMYAVISDEILNFFAGIKDFNNAIGAPVERYRQNYKTLSKLRQMFFDRVGNSPDIERFMDYYKWLDSSLSIMIDQFVPASVAASEDIRNVIESHVLERNKFHSKYPTIEFKEVKPVGQIRAVNELLYDWKHGHAPLGSPNNKNCLWISDRAQRNSDLFVSGALETDADREIIRRVSVTSVSGSTYATRKLSRPYRLSVEDQRHAKGGDNTFGNKKKRFFTGVTSAHEKTYIAVTASEASSTPCRDVINPHKKHKVHAPGDIAFSNKDRDINDVAPFTLYSSSLDDVRGYHAAVFDGFKKGVEIANIHSDEYGDDREVTLQSPFTERWVGGNAHRHQDAVLEPAVRANATITISDANTENLGHNSKITIKSAEGRVVTYRFGLDVGYANQNTLNSNGEVLVPTDTPTSGSNTSMINLASAILSKNGHRGEIQVSRSGTTLTLIQRTAGPAGNTTIESQFTAGAAVQQFSITGTPVNGETFSITDELNTTQVFIIDTSVATKDGTRDGSDRVIVGLDGISTFPDRGAAFKSAINGARTKGYLSEVYASIHTHPLFATAQVHMYIYSNTTTKINFEAAESVSWASATSVSQTTLPATRTITSFTNGRDGFDSRVEAFKILPRDSKLYVLPPNATGLDASNLPVIDHNIQSAQLLREPLAKRPVNIRNISITSSARSLGNFNHPYDVVQYTSEDQRKDFLVDNLEQVTSSNSTGIPGVQEFGKLPRPKRKTVFKARFSAPGGTETSGDSLGGHSMDRATNQYSVYNSLNYRNLSVRGPLDYLSKIPQTGSAGKKATATVTITNFSNFANGDEVAFNLTNGKRIRAQSHNPGTTSTEDAEKVSVHGESTFQVFVDETSNEVTAQNLATALNAKPGIAATAAGAVVTITQDVAGSNGNGVIDLKFGGSTAASKTDFTGGNDTDVSFVTNHRVNANPRHRRYMSDSSYSDETKIQRDNVFVQHPIPQNDYQYAWISSSLETGRAGHYLSRGKPRVDFAGYLHSFTQASLGGNVTGSLKYERTYDFVSGSQGRWGRHTFVENGPDYYDLSFAGYNIPGTNLQDHITASSNTIAAEADSFISGTILHRQGPYGWPSWKQLRVGESFMGRYLKRKSIYAPPITMDGDTPVVKTTTNGNYSWPDRTTHLASTSETDVSNTNYRYTDPPVSSNRYPIRLTGIKLYRGAFYAVENQFSFSNIVGKFATDDLTKLLRVETAEDHKKSILDNNMLREFDLSPVAGGAAQLEIDIFPKEESAYLEKTRQRTKFKTDNFWLASRKARTKANLKNSQGNTVSKLSIWPLDAPENFRTTAMKKTTEALGTDGSGELFANYSVFHNDLSNPIPSALFARPFPVQATSSLPNSFVARRDQLSASYSGGRLWQNGFESYINGVIPNDWGHTVENSLEVQDFSSPSGDFGIGEIHPGMPPGWKSPLTSNGTTFTTSSGPAEGLLNTTTVRYGQDSGFINGSSALIFTGFTVSKAAMYDPPQNKTYPRYRWIRTTSSYDFPGKISFVLKTGNSSVDGCTYGLHTATTPFFVQIGDEDQTRGDRGYRTVALIGSSSAEISEYANSTFFKYVEVDVTASLTDQKIRFVTACTGSSYEGDTSGRWAIKHINVLKTDFMDRDADQQDSPKDFKVRELVISDMTASAQTDLLSPAFDSPGFARKMFSPAQSKNSSVSTLALSRYQDHRKVVLSAAGEAVYAEGKGGNNTTFFISEASGTFDFVLRQSGSARIQNIYAKDERLDHHLFGSQFFKTPELSGRNPFNFEGYEDFIHEPRLIAKDYSLVPEFRISEHMDHYINTVGGADPFFSCNDSLFTITGSTSPESSDQDNFYKTYSHTDFVKDFEVVKSQMSDIKDVTPGKLTLKCKALKKFLPYKGFYPADRMVELASEFSSSYSKFTTGGLWRNVLSPYYAPGIGFNTIKSGLAVDYPVFEPHSDRPYNQYGVIFQSASLNASASPAYMNPTSAEYDNYPKPKNQLSLNRIEVGGGSEWAKSLTGSLAGGGHSDKICVSWWMYLPNMSTYQELMPRLDQNDPDATLKPFSMHPGMNNGTVLSLGSGEIQDQSAWKKGLHIGYHIGQVGSYTNTYGYVGNSISQGLSGHNGLKLFRPGLLVCGGDGRNYFAMRASALTSNDNARWIPGWNHCFVEMDVETVGTDGLKAYINGNELDATVSWLTGSGFQSDGTIDANGSGAKIKLEGHRNCFIGNHLGCTKAINAAATTAGSIGDLGKNVTGANADGEAICPAEHVKFVSSTTPAECMMTEIMVFNKNIPKQYLYSLAGVKEGRLPVGPDIDQSTSRDSGRSFDMLKQYPPGDQKGRVGPKNPYTTLPKNLHKNLIAWYRPGNDTGYKRKSGTVVTGEYLEAGNSHTNYMPVFNHAADLYSGKTIMANSGSLVSEEKNLGSSANVARLANHLSGTFYGFSDWSGSLDDSLKWSDTPRVRWNGIADISNPAQYTLTYHLHGDGQRSGTTTLIHKGFKTWWTNNDKAQQWYGAVTDDYLVEKSLLNQSDDNLTGSHTFITGAISTPSFIVGSKFNFTDDASIPRIGSASYGTSHYTSSLDIENTPLYSQGWITDRQGDTGVKSVTRVPFEAIIDPGKFTPPSLTGDDKVIEFFEMEPHPSASLLGANTTNRRLTKGIHGPVEWTGSFDTLNNDGVKGNNFFNGIAQNSSSLMTSLDLDAAAREKTMYTRAASNFYAESLNFFVANGKGVTIRSSDTPNEVSKESYECTITVHHGGKRGDNPMYNNPAAFGMPIDAGRIRDISSNGTNLLKHMDKVGYGFTPYLPPHYDGQASALLQFTPDPNTSYNSVRQILSETTVTYRRRCSATGSISDLPGDVSFFTGDGLRKVPGSYNERFAMQLSASFSGLGFEDDNNFVQSYNPATGESLDKSSLVIQSRFECPTFDFTGVATSDVDQPRTEKAIQHLPKVRGIWHQTGSVLGNKPSVVLRRPRGRLGDLASLIGLEVESDYNEIGQLPSSRLVREAVVAVPFKTVNGEKEFFKLPREEVYQSVRDLGFDDYRLDTELGRREQREAANRLAAEQVKQALAAGNYNPDLNSPPLKVTPRESIFNMVNSMMRYNIPPQFNFLKYNNPEDRYIEPFAMYIFDFSVTLDRSDLANIWQNVTPDIGLDTYDGGEGSRIISSTEVEHDFSDNNLLSEGKFDEDVQWMVFKVKQKAQVNYFKKRRFDKLPDGHPEKKISVENDIFDYGFNWPYDYFSLVELVNIGAQVDFKKDEDEN